MLYRSTDRYRCSGAISKNLTHILLRHSYEKIAPPGPEIEHIRNSFTSLKIILITAMLHVRFPRSLRNVGDLLHDRGIEVSHETVRFWGQRFGPMFAAEIR